jgi:ABC-type dipeptide/oligopeptide/nickel transport system ATPase component
MMDQRNGRSPIIMLNNVIKRFPVGGKELTILKGIDFTVQPGEFVAIVGPVPCKNLISTNISRRMQKPHPASFKATKYEEHFRRWDISACRRVKQPGRNQFLICWLML